MNKKNIESEERINRNFFLGLFSIIAVILVVIFYDDYYQESFIEEKVSIQQKKETDKDILLFQSQVKNMSEVNFLKVEKDTLYMCVYHRDENLTMLDVIDLSRITKPSFLENKKDGMVVHFKSYYAKLSISFRVIENSGPLKFKDLNSFKKSFDKKEGHFCAKEFSVTFDDMKKSTPKLRRWWYETICRISKKCGGCKTFEESLYFVN